MAPQSRSLMWIPGDAAAEDGPLLVDAAPAFGKPVAVRTTRAELTRLIQRIQGETETRRCAVSNDAYRRCLAYEVPAEVDPKCEAFQRFCGDVLVFYCARHVIDGRGVPTASQCAQEAPEADLPPPRG